MHGEVRGAPRCRRTRARAYTLGKHIAAFVFPAASAREACAHTTFNVESARPRTSAQPPPFGKSALRLPLHAACSAAPVSIRRPRSRVPRLGTRLGGLRLAVLRCVRPHCRAGVVPVPFRQRGKIAQVVLAMTWFTDNYITRYGMTQSYQAEADLRCAGTTRK